MIDYIVSVDLGQSQDYSALAVLRRCWGPATGELWRHEVPTLMRWPLLTPYPLIVDDIERVCRGVDTELSRWGTRLVVDHGGPGRPVVDELRARALDPAGVTITGGGMVNVHADGSVTVPKAEICQVFAAEAEARALKLPADAELAAEFSEELRAFGYVENPETHRMSYGSRDPAVHDDLVLAVAMGLWYSTTQLSTLDPAGITQ